MKIDFSNKNLKELCESEKKSKKKFGKQVSGKLKSRLADILAAERVGDLAVGRPHPLTGDRLGQFSLTLHSGVALCFEADMDEIPTDENGVTIWKDVTSVKIVFIGDYHD